MSANGILQVNRLQQWSTFGILTMDGFVPAMGLREDEVVTIDVDLTDWLNTGETISTAVANHGSFTTAINGGIITMTVTATRSRYNEIGITCSTGRVINLPFVTWVREWSGGSDYQEAIYG